MKMNPSKAGGTRVLATLASLVSTAPAIAQDAPGALEGVMVTARKREESLQSVPRSITALSTEQIAASGIVDLKSIGHSTPGLQSFNIGSGYSSAPIIRGMAQTNLGTAEATVGVFVDGVYLTSRNALDLTILDLERIEVVKGPRASSTATTASPAPSTMFRGARPRTSSEPRR